MLHIFLLLKDTCSKLADHFCDKKKLSIADIFKIINTLNVFLQSEGDALPMSDKITAFQRKLALWREHFGNKF